MLKFLQAKDISIDIKDSEIGKFEVKDKDYHPDYFIFQEEALKHLRQALRHPEFYKHIIITGPEGVGKRVGIQALLNREFSKKNQCPKYYYLRTNNTIILNPDYTDGMIPLFDSDANTTPIIYDPSPSTVDLVGIPYEKKYHPGTLVKACGGYLILPMFELIEDKHLYEILRSTLISGKINFMNLPEMNFYQKMDRTLPCLPIDVRVILIGSEDSYEALYRRDNDLHEVFSFRVDMADEADLTKKNNAKFFTLIDTFWKKDYPKANNLAKKKLLIEALRINDSRSRFSLKLAEIKSIYEEAMVLFSDKKEIGDAEIDTAIQNIENRNSIYKRRYYDSLRSGDYKISLTGKKIGRINALTILSNPYHRLEYGQVNVISARVMVGSGNLLNIDKEVNLSGDIHDKGVLILQSYLKGAFSHLVSFGLDASIVFEQNNSMVDGDSASVAMLIAIISAWSECEIPSTIAVTGALSQYGDALPVGSINLKIESFYQVSKEFGSSKEVYTIYIPDSNLNNVVLSQEIIEAIEKNKFRVVLYSHINELLPDVLQLPLGKIEKDGKYTKNSIFRRIEERLDKKKESEKESNS